ncbi:hypothetical protein [Bradyrhizobium zhanjiangense]|uniref:hypothetical protein n=1 Tax=Bradyrhizobium zhanjiangense TaxID=1325107 RepID=UPI001008BBED|nr:hypothetical protein [Bradyrhizobium zhanjiangense]
MRIGHDLANEQTLVNLETILVGLHALTLGRQLSLRRQNVGPACSSRPKKRINAKGLCAFACEFAIRLHGMTTEKSPHSVGRQMNDGLPSLFLRLRPLRA